MLEACLIREMKEEDLLLVLSWRNHIEVRRFMFSSHEIELTEHCNWFAKVSQDSTRRLLIFEIAKERRGFVQFSKVTNGGMADWGFYISPEAAQGTGRKLGITALNYAFCNLNLQKVSGYVVSSNKGSIAFHQRMGFTFERVVPNQQLIDGSYCNLHCFGMLASDWKPENLIKK